MVDRIVKPVFLAGMAALALLLYGCPGGGSDEIRVPVTLPEDWPLEMAAPPEGSFRAKLSHGVDYSEDGGYTARIIRPNSESVEWLVAFTVDMEITEVSDYYENNFKAMGFQLLSRTDDDSSLVLSFSSTQRSMSATLWLDKATGVWALSLARKEMVEEPKNRPVDPPSTGGAMPDQHTLQ